MPTLASRPSGRVDRFTERPARAACSTVVVGGVDVTLVVDDAGRVVVVAGATVVETAVLAGAPIAVPDAAIVVVGAGLARPLTVPVTALSSDCGSAAIGDVALE
jgi:hypothetical protein